MRVDERMSTIGPIIRHERLKQKMKQSTLAKGICSASHLSKIESGAALPSEEVLSSLVDRLGISIKELTDEEEEKIIDSLTAVYRNGVLKRDKEQIRAFLLSYSGQTIHFNHLNHFYSYHLLLFRLFLILQDKDRDLLPFIDALRAVDDQFNPHQRFIFHTNIGLYEYLNYKFFDSLMVLEKNLDLLRTAALEEWELADYYAILGNAYHKNGENFSAVHYTSKALDYYKDHLLFERAMDCYILLGASYRNLKHFQSARENYSLALKLADDFNLPYYKGMCYHNIGSLHSLEDNSEKALEFFHLSLETKKLIQEPEKNLVTILALIVEYSKSGNSLLALRWCQKGINYLEQELAGDRSALPVSYRHHFNIYEAIHSQGKDLETLVRDALKHFEKIRDMRHIQKYSVLLGDHLFQHNKFKLAGEYYQRANDILYKQRNVEKWEDL